MMSRLVDVVKYIVNEYMNLYKYQRPRSFINQGHSYSIFSNFFSLETTRPIEAKFHVEPPLDEGLFK